MLDGHGGMHAVHTARQAVQHALRFGTAGRLAEDGAVELDDRIRTQHRKA